VRASALSESTAGRNCARLLGLGAGEIALALHEVDDHVRPGLRPPQVPGRREMRRRDQKPRQHRRLRRIHFRRRAAEIALRSGLEAARSRAQEGAVHVDRQDLVLRIAQLQREGVGQFLQLPPDGAAAAIGLVGGLAFPFGRIVGHAQAQELGDLLRDGRAAVTLERPAPGGQVDPHGAGDPPRRDAEMPPEAAILGRDDGVLQMRRDGVGGDRAAKAFAAPGEDIAIGIEHRDRSARAPVQEVGRVGQAGIEVERRGREDERDDGDHAPGHAPDHPPDKREEPAHRARQEVPALRLAGAAAPGPLVAAAVALCAPARRAGAPVGHQGGSAIACTAHASCAPGHACSRFWRNIATPAGFAKSASPPMQLS
jgi:hypothetical protein